MPYRDRPIMVSHIDAELVAAAPAAGVAAQPTHETLPRRIAARDPGVHQPAGVVPDRVDACAAAGDDAGERRIVGEAVQRPVLELVQQTEQTGLRSHRLPYVIV
jgi:hypothetical protein